MKKNLIYKEDEEEEKETHDKGEKKLLADVTVNCRRSAHLHT